MEIKLEHLIIGGLTTALLTTLVCSGKSSVSQKKREKELLNAINVSMDDLANGKVTIPDAVVRNAVDRAVERHYDSAINSLVEASTTNISADIKAQARRIVNDSYSDLKKSTLDILTEEAGKLDASSMRDEIVDRCLKNAEDRFSKDVDKCVKKYVDQIKTATSSGARVAESVLRGSNGIYILKADD